MEVDGHIYVHISGEVLVSKVSGEVVKTVSISGSSILTLAHATGEIMTTFSSAVPFALENVTCRFSSNAEVAENFVVELDSASGAEFDTVLASVDPSISGASSIFIAFDPPTVMTSGDSVWVTYPNSSGMEYGLRVVARYLG